LQFDTANPDHLTDRAKAVLVEAERVAMARNSSDIAPEDLLLALARRDRGVGRCILEEMSIDLQKLQDELSLLAPHRERGVSWRAALGFSPEALHVLAWAKEEAAALNHRYLGTEHLVLGLLRDEKSKAGSFLRERSASSERAREILCAILYRDEGS
jgi:ATP-dependent Clp protease ATP-binding subunit ClpC